MKILTFTKKNTASLLLHFKHDNHHNIEEVFSQVREWIKNPPKFLLQIILLSLVCSIIMLGFVLTIALVRHAPIGDGLINNVNDIIRPGVGELLKKNILVLLFHSLVCFAAFLGFYVIPEQTKNLKNKYNIIFHKFVSKFVLFFIIFATSYAIIRQVWITSSSASDLSNLYGLEIGQIIISILPHALLELTGMFLPLGALVYWEIKRLNPKQLFPLSIYTFIIGLVFVIIAALVEHYLWAGILENMIFRFI